MPRVFVLGIDGATWNVLDPLLDAGHLPNLARLQDEGIRTDLASTFIHASAPAWSTFMTGVNPGQHGVFYFQGPWRDGVQRPVLDSRDIRARSMWEIASSAGRRVSIVNVPLTYPPRPVNGVMVAGMLLAPLAMGEEMTFPPSLYEELRTQVGDFGLTIRATEFKELSPEEFLNRLALSVSRRAGVIEYLLGRDDWNLFVAVFDETDRLQHYLWQDLDPSHRLHDPVRSARVTPRVRDFFADLDAAIGRILNSVPEDAVVMVLSDHGFGLCNFRVYMNKWLQEIGVLHLKPTLISSAGRSVVRDVLASLDILGVRRWLPARSKRMVTSNPYQRVDWSRTQAYAATATELGFFVNLQDREPFGSVAPGAEYEAVRDRLVDALRDLRHPATGEPLIDHVYRREEVFSGRHIDGAPDVLYTFASPADCMPKTAVDAEGLFAEAVPWESGSHRRSGILLISGPQISRDTSLENPEIADVAPTILHLLDIPVPHYMDGRVWPLLPGTTPRYTSEIQMDVDRRVNEDIYSDADQAEIRDRLRNLGYLD